MYKIGDYCKATVRGVENVAVVRVQIRAEYLTGSLWWRSIQLVNGHAIHYQDHVTNIRKMVAFDPSEFPALPAFLREAAELWRHHNLRAVYGGHITLDRLAAVVEGIDKPKAPTKTYSRVRTTAGRIWVKVSSDDTWAEEIVTSNGHTHLLTGTLKSYNQIDAVEVLDD